jgi:hypothetical protein
MSSSESASQSDSASAASESLAPPAETVRACADRERRLTEYIRAHTGEDIVIRLTPHVLTACVMPTSEESLVESDNAEFSAEQAEQLVESVNAEYLVLISTHPATVDNLPISDQLTADRAQQFGYALHELGHIRYTAIADAAALLEGQVDEEYQEFVHGLWNSCEDAAIENQLALDQSQLAADRLELVSRSISPHADGVADDDCYEHTFRDAIDVALYDTGIYDTGIRDALCDPDDRRFVFASDADQRAFEQVADSIDELVGTVLSTPAAVDRAEHVLDWWKTTIKPLLNPPEQQQQKSEQPDPDGAGGESSTDGRSNSNRSTDSANNCGTDQSTDESADTDRSLSESEATQNGEDTADSSNPAANPESGGRDESVTADAIDEAGENDWTAGSQSDKRPDPDSINTDQRQSSPGTDALDYPDIGGDADATALQQSQSNSEAGSESEGRDERERETESQSAVDSTENEQTADDDNTSRRDSNTDTSADTPIETGGESVDDSGSNGESFDRDNADSSAHADTDGHSVGEGESGETADTNDDATSRAEASPDSEAQSDQKAAGSKNRGDGNGTDEATESPEQGGEGGADGTLVEPRSQQNSWRADGSTDQSTLGSFSTAETSPTENDVNASNDGRSGKSGETPATTPDSERDGPSPGVGDDGELELESELEVEAGKSDTEDGSKDNTSTDTSADVDAETDRSENTTHEEGNASDNRSSNRGGNDDSTSAAREQHGDTPDETQSEADKQPTVPTPVHAGGNDGLDRDRALDTDRDAAHDEADRATPDEQALACELTDVTDALDALAEQDGGGAAPGSLSELTIMPDTGGLITTDTAERWGKAVADAEFVADTLRKALKESRRDAHRSGVTSGTFDRQRAGALARGDVGAFHVRQPGDDKQYDLVMILDRSGSMRRHIETAENALVRFALACEDIGINVGVIDFTDDEARLVKPFSVECEHVRGSFLSSQYGGNTPLADALGLGRELLEQRRNTPLVIVVTDGKPGDEDAYQDELAQAYAPVCGLTLVLDQSSGNVPEKVARNERFYDRHVYVHGPSQLADRLDQFAVMFDGL